MLNVNAAFDFLFMRLTDLQHRVIVVSAQGFFGGGVHHPNLHATAACTPC